MIKFDPITIIYTNSITNFKSWAVAVSPYHWYSDTNFVAILACSGGSGS